MATLEWKKGEAIRLYDKKKVIGVIEKSLREHDLADIKEVAKINRPIAGFILCSCFIEHICTFCYAPDRVSDKDFIRFVVEYLNPVAERVYKPNELREDLRNKLVHNYSIGASYGLMGKEDFKHRDPHPKLPAKEVLKLDDFVNELEQAFNRYITDLKEDKGALQSNAVLAFHYHNIIGLSNLQVENP
jgi:hypothetical protein